MEMCSTPKRPTNNSAPPRIIRKAKSIRSLNPRCVKSLYDELNLCDIIIDLHRLKVRDIHSYKRKSETDISNVDKKKRKL